MERDENEHLEAGQNVQGTFHLADFFVDASDLDAKTDVKQSGRTTKELRHRADLKRVLEILFGHPNRTPTRDEYGCSRRRPQCDGLPN